MSTTHRTLAAVAITAALLAGCKPEPTPAASTDMLDDLAAVPITTTEQHGYDRDAFRYAEVGDCNTRELARQRDLDAVDTIDGCRVSTGTLTDPYTGTVINFERSANPAVQVDHVVPMSYAWRNNLDPTRVVEFGNDLDNLLVVAADANQDKADQGPASWLPPNEAFHCDYAARFTTIVLDYQLTLPPDDKDALTGILTECE